MWFLIILYIVGANVFFVVIGLMASAGTDEKAPVGTVVVAALLWPIIILIVLAALLCGAFLGLYCFYRHATRRTSAREI